VIVKAFHRLLDDRGFWRKRSPVQNRGYSNALLEWRFFLLHCVLFLIARSNRFIGKTSGGMPRVLFQILVKLFYAVHDRRCHVVMSVIRIQTDVLTAC